MFLKNESQESWLPAWSARVLWFFRPRTCFIEPSVCVNTDVINEIFHGKLRVVDGLSRHFTADRQVQDYEEPECA